MMPGRTLYVEHGRCGARPGEEAALDGDSGECGGNRLGVRAEVKAIVDGSRADCRRFDPVASNESRSHGRQTVGEAVYVHVPRRSLGGQPRVT